jgi:Mg2+ and Co2+ transporter CorA
VEDDSLYQTEDETASVMSSQIQNVNIIEPSSIYSSRAASPPAVQRRRPQNKISLNRNDNEIVGEITTKLIEEGITPTADKINEIASKDYQIQQKVVTEQKLSSQETVVHQQQNQVVQTPVSIGIPQAPAQHAFVLPSTHLQHKLEKKVSHVQFNILIFWKHCFLRLCCILSHEPTKPNR